jgi:hypothetical protein
MTSGKSGQSGGRGKGNECTRPKVQGFSSSVANQWPLQGWIMELRAQRKDKLRKRGWGNTERRYWFVCFVSLGPGVYGWRG